LSALARARDNGLADVLHAAGGLLPRSWPSCCRGGTPEGGPDVSKAKNRSSAAVASRDPGLLDVLNMVLPALGPKAARRLCAVARTTAEVCSSAALSALAWGSIWQTYLEAAAPPLAELAKATSFDAPAVVRAAALGELLPELRAGLWAPDAHGRPPLVLAASRRGPGATKGSAPSAVSALLAARASPNARSRDGWTALMWAATAGDLGTMRRLLRAKARVDVIAKEGTSALLCATRADRNDCAMVQLLLDHGADPALVPMQSPFDEHVAMDVRQALADAKRNSKRR